MEDIIGMLIPLGVCVVLPIMVVWLVMNTAKFREAKRTEVLIKAIESGKDIDANMIANAMSKPRKAIRTPRELLNLRLCVGSVFTLIGAFLTTIVILCFWPDEKAMLVFGGISSIFLAIGLGFLITYFATRKQVKD